MTKEERKKYNKEHYILNKEKRSIQKREWTKSNKEYHYELNKQWKSSNKERLQRINLKAKYGISLEEFKKLEEKQDNKCAICGEQEKIKRNGKK